MRIISGDAKGRTLFAPQGAETRPTSDKLRGSIFNILGGRVEDARVLDLFGGTGALALEALSRGAERAVISDTSRAAVQCIERNARNVLKDDYDRRVRVLRADYRAAIDKADDTFDLVFLDPPYRMVGAYGDALERLANAGRLAPGCVIVMERARQAEIELPPAVMRKDLRLYGDTAVEFAEWSDAPGAVKNRDERREDRTD